MSEPDGIGLSPLTFRSATGSVTGTYRKEFYAYELFGQPHGIPPEQAVLTIVAVANFYIDDLRDWAAYWLPFPPDYIPAFTTSQRVSTTSQIGTKIPRDVACAMFPRFDPTAYRE